MLCAWALVVAAALAGGCRSAPEPLPDLADQGAVPYQIHRQRLEVPVAGRHPRLEVINPHGDIRLRPGGPGAVEILAVAQRLGEAPEVEALEAGPTPDGARVVVRYPSDRRRGLDHRPNGHRKGRVDLVVFAPAGTRAELTGRDDLVAARRFDGTVRARSRDGSIKVSVRGRADLASRDGAVSLTLMRPRWEEPARIETRAGDVTVYLPESARPRLDLATAGEVRLPPDWPARHRRRSGRNHHWLDGDPRSALKVHSGHGMITLGTLPE